MLKINVNLVTATVQETEVLTSGRVGLQCAFTFSEEWDGLVKTATFEGAESADVAMLNGNVVTVPHECMSSPGAKLRVGVCGMNTDGDIVIPTIWANAGRIQQGAEPSGIPAAEPTPNWAAQVQEAAASALEIARGVKNEADSGEFDGTDGVSPTASVTRSGDTVYFSVEDANGTTTVEIHDGAAGQTGATGETGATGAPGSSVWVSDNFPDEFITVDGTSYAWFSKSYLKGKTGVTPQAGDTVVFPGALWGGAWSTNLNGVYVVKSVTTTDVYTQYYGQFIGPKGDTGNTGSSATVAVGTTKTGAAGTNASVTNSGTSSAAVFDFTIPKGDKGDTGAGVPIGGTAGQILRKKTSDNYDFEWTLETSDSENIPLGARSALLTLLEHVAYTDANGATYYQNLYNALYVPSALDHITAVFAQGANVIYDADSLNTLEQYLVVTAYYEDNTSEVVAAGNYELSGSLTAGTSTITVTYGGETDTFNVTVTDHTTVMSYKYSDGDLVKRNGSVKSDTTNGFSLDVQSSNTPKRRTFTTIRGTVALKQYTGSTWAATDPPAYPIPVPATATNVSVAITPSSQYFGISGLVLSSDKYTMTLDDGWKQGSRSLSFTAGTYTHICLNCKQNSSGTNYTTEPTEMTVTFS